MDRHPCGAQSLTGAPESQQREPAGWNPTLPLTGCKEGAPVQALAFSAVEWGEQNLENLRSMLRPDL